jgi:hypothetical protein
VRPGEENAVERMIKHAPVAVDRPKYADPHTKVNALLQAHFSRERLSGDMGNDARTAVREASRLLQVRLARMRCGCDIFTEVGVELLVLCACADGCGRRLAPAAALTVSGRM